ncbi:MAG: beta-galactosidase [bacterium]
MACRVLFLLMAAMVACPGSALAEAGLRRPGGKPTADYDGKSFKIGDRRVLFLSGGLHYFRIPPALWRERLLQTKLAGFNTIETPVPWSLHQPSRDAFVTEGFADLGRFLDLCHELGFRVIVRVGPYVNATLSNGGLPTWLGAVPKLRVRSANPPFLEAVKAYWRRLLPILVRRQVPDGPVFLVQVEDHYEGRSRGYLTKLADELVLGGCRVPIVLSELHPCKQFQDIRVSDKQVWATTDFSPTGPLPWGEIHRPFGGLDDVLLEGVARGIDGYNLPLWAGGTHFAVLPASSFPTRFEASTCGLLESGQRTPVHTQLKPVNLFLLTFQDVLTASQAAPGHWLLEAARRDGMVAHARTDGTTTLVFLKRRYGKRPFEFNDKTTGTPASLVVGDGLLCHVVLNYPLTPKTTLALSGARILTIHEQPDRVHIVASSQEKGRGYMAFHTAARPQPVKGGAAMRWDADHKRLVVRWQEMASREVTDYVFDADRRIQLTVFTEETMDEAWVLEGAGVLLGAPGVKQWTPSSIELLVPTRRTRRQVAYYPFGSQRSVSPQPCIEKASYEEATSRIGFTLHRRASPPIPVLLREWQMAPLTREVNPDFDASAWTATPRPRPLGQAPYGWYRSVITSDRQRRRTLIFKDAADSITVFLNGQYLDQSGTKRLMDTPRAFATPQTVEAPIEKGRNVLAVLVKNWGRYRLTEIYDQPLAEATGWGLLDDVTLDGALVSPWRQHTGLSPEGRALDWGRPAKGGCPVRWYRTTFKLRESEARPIGRLKLNGLRHGALWLNGHFLGLYLQRGYDGGHGYYVPPHWLEPVNTLIVLEEGGAVPERPEFNYERRAALVPLRITFR